MPFHASGLLTALSQTAFEWIARYGYASLVALLALGIVGLPVPDESLLAFAGFLVFKGELRPLPTLAAAVAGSLTGVTISYAVGRRFGAGLLRRYGPRLHLPPAEIERVEAWFDRLGKWLLPFAYFVPGVRHVAAFVAGSAKLRPRTFCFFAYAGGVLWATTFLGAGYLLGDEWAAFAEKARSRLLVAALVATTAGAAWWLIAHRRGGKGRGTS